MPPRALTGASSLEASQLVEVLTGRHVPPLSPRCGYLWAETHAPAASRRVAPVVVLALYPIIAAWHTYELVDLCSEAIHPTSCGCLLATNRQKSCMQSKIV